MRNVGRRLKLILVASLSVVLLGTGIFSQAVWGQEAGFNVSLSPLPVLLADEPGTQVVTDLRVRNLNNQAEVLKVELFKFRADDSGVVIEDPTPEDEFIDWVSFSDTRFTAPSNQWVTIQMTVDIPPDAAFGYYYAVVFSRADEPSPEVGQAAIEGGAAVFVLLEAVVPGAVRAAQMVDLSVEKRIYEFLPATVRTTIQNTGNIHVAPQGNVFIKKGDQELGSVPINETAGNILPASSRQFTASWSDGFPYYQPRLLAGQPVTDESGKVERKLVWNASEINRLRFGKYQAELVMVYNDGVRDVPIRGVAEFWVIPWRLLALALALGGFLAFNVYLLFGRIFGKRGGKKKFVYQRW